MQQAQQPRSDIPIAAASKRFGRYNQIGPEPVRQMALDANELEHLRQRRELLRCMTPEQALQVIEFHKGLNVFEALDLAKREGKVIVPNYVHDRILTETEGTAFFVSYLVWTGSVVIYEAPGRAFGENVVFHWEGRDNAQHAISSVIPPAFRGIKDCALIVEHPDFDFVSLGSRSYELRAADESRVHLLEKFPREGKHPYRFDEILRIPSGARVQSDDGVRYLGRLDHSFLGLVARGGLGISRRNVLLGNAPSVAFGVAVF
ncbi:MAG: hypothetical protein AB1529_00500 [Candidatus Micrarchaeota archaeon]